MIHDERAVKRFWAKVDIQGSDECWMWKASLGTTGYGQFMVMGPKKRPHKASRVAYEIAKGATGEMDVLHTCDNPPCCNPAHLWLGTAYDNVHDAMEKGRFVPPPVALGIKSHFAKLTEAQIREIREMIIGGATDKEIALKFTMDRSYPLHLRKGKIWRHFEPEHAEAVAQAERRRNAA